MTSSTRSYHRSLAAGRLPERRGRFQAVKPRVYGTAEDIAARAFDEAGGVPQVADFFGVRPAVVYAMTDPQQRGDLSVSRALRLTQFLGVKVIVEAFAAAAGGAFLPAPETSVAQSLVELGAESNSEMADLVRSILDAIADGKITKMERRTIRHNLDVLLHTLVRERAKLIAMENEDRGEA